MPTNDLDGQITVGDGASDNTQVETWTKNTVAEHKRDFLAERQTRGHARHVLFCNAHFDKSLWVALGEGVSSRWLF